jgi:chromosome segregation ATPase
MMVEDRDRIQSEHVTLLVRFKKLRGKYERLKLEHEKDRLEHHRLDAELAALREALGLCKPGEIASLREEHSSLQAETDRLRARIQTLHGELVARGDLEELIALRDEEIRSAGVQRDQFKEQIQRLEEALTASHDAREQISRQWQDLRDQLETLHAERDQFYQGLHERDEALKSTRAKLEELDQQLRQRCDELGTKQAEVERLAGERQATLSNSEKLHTAFAQREQELSLESDQRRVEIEALRRTLDEVGQRHRDDQSQLAKQLRLMREQLDSAESQVAALQARNSELLDDRMKLETDHHAILECERSRLSAEFQSVLDADRSRQAQQLALIQASSDENAQLADRLRAEISTLALSRTALENGLEAARSEIEAQRTKLAEKEAQGRSVSALLGQMGIQIS